MKYTIIIKKITHQTLRVEDNNGQIQILIKLKSLIVTPGAQTHALEGILAPYPIFSFLCNAIT